MVVAHGDIAARAYTTGYNGWREICDWINNNTRRPFELVIRLYWQTGTNKDAMNGDIGATLGQQFYQQIVQPSCDQGITHFQVLNELNEEYTKPRSELAGDMYNIAWWIKHLAAQDNHTVQLGFPGPGGGALDPANAQWAEYWNGYKGIITKATEHGPAYDWLAVHCYENSPSGLDGRMRGQYNWLSKKFPNYPLRWTEYGIPLFPHYHHDEHFPCMDPNKFKDRANDCASAIRSFRAWIAQQRGPDVMSVHYYLAGYQNYPGAQQGQPTRFALVMDNNNLEPAQTLADTF